MFKKVYKQTEEHRKKIGLSRKGKKLSPEHREKVIKTLLIDHNPHRFKKGQIPHNKGIPWTQEIKDNISKGIKNNPNRKKTSYWKGKKGGSGSGERHWNWQGGITEFLIKIRKCFEYRQWRSDCFTRDDYTCRICNIRGYELQVDHYPKSFAVIIHENNIKSLEEALQCQELWNINNGRTLCIDCHRKTENYAKKIGNINK